VSDSGIEHRAVCGKLQFMTIDVLLLLLLISLTQ
jgi:hypothetical protein